MRSLSASAQRTVHDEQKVCSLPTASVCTKTSARNIHRFSLEFARTLIIYLSRQSLSLSLFPIAQCIHYTYTQNRRTRTEERILTVELSAGYRTTKPVEACAFLQATTAAYAHGRLSARPHTLQEHTLAFFSICRS